VPDSRNSLNDALKYAQISGMLIGPMLAFGAIGFWLDRRYGTKPWFLLAGLILGMVGGFVNLFKLVLPPKDRGSDPGAPAP
jgi:F0F1-type ATP synthase assembly protein I